MEFEKDKFEDECGVMGISSARTDIAALYVYFGLYALQHRGQESCGIVSNNGGELTQKRGMGLVGDIFTTTELKEIEGNLAIGHVRYSTFGDKDDVKNAQPLTVNTKDGKIALGHNGNLINADALRDMLQDDGVVFITDSDTEVIANLIARNYKQGIVEALKRVGQIIKGAYAMVLTAGDKLIGVRDPYGLRPLCLGKCSSGYVLASESCGLDAVGAKLVRDVEPGEIIVIEKGDVQSYKIDVKVHPSRCIFELVYFARPDSVIDTVEVHDSRRQSGKLLAGQDKSKDIKADVVFGVPDSGNSAAMGYAEGAGIPYGVGLIKNRYVGRTFIQPTQEMREEGVRIKLNALKSNVEGKSIVLVDDSIVRGTTSKRIVDMLREAGAKEIHFRVSSPPTSYSCFFGIDTPSRKKLISSYMSMDEICEYIGADSLDYLTMDNLKKSVKNYNDGYCMACFTGDYPMEVPANNNEE